MKKQDEILNNIKRTALEQEQQDFDQKEKVWSVVKGRLSHKKRKRMIYKTISAAAIIIVIFTISFQWFNNSNPKKSIEPAIVNDEAEKEEKTDILKDDTLDKKEKELENSITAEDTIKESKIAQPEKKQDVEVATSMISEDTAQVSNKTAITINTEKAKKGNDDQIQERSVTGLNRQMADAKTDQAPVNKTIEGRVIDQDSLPIPGVNIMTKDSRVATRSDFDGEFSIEVKKGEVLVFSYLGYKKQEVKIDDQEYISVVLEHKNQALAEVAVTGYSNKMERKNVSASVTNIGSNALADTDDQNIKQNQNARNIHNNQPLFIVNGSEVSSKQVNKLASNKLEKMLVFKGKVARALYGNKARKGVVEILTKKADRSQRRYFDSIRIRSLNIKNNESFDTYQENPFTSPLKKPLSTFSADVDRAAYTNIRRMINNAQKVPKDAVRIEEMLNFFEYDYDRPSGKHPFAIHNVYSDAPWNDKHKLLKIALQGKDISVRKLPASNLVFLIDVSGSMDHQNKLPLVKRSLELLVDQMREKDKIALVTYAGNAQVVLDPTAGDQKTRIKNAIDRLSSGGGTYASQGIETAYSLAEENFVQGGNNRVIIATDGDFNIGVIQNESLEDLIAKKRQTNIFLTCLGYGMGNYKDDKMQSLAQKGNGNYAYIDNYQEAQKFLEREFKGSMYAIAKDVKIQIEFNPKHVQSYRLIGYETRMLNSRDFSDDKKDAGEIGVNHQVTALYEIIPRGVDGNYGEFDPDLKYQESTQQETELETYPDELATIKFRYKPPKRDKSIKIERVIKNESTKLSNTDADHKFATAVAWFGLKLRDSEYISKKDTEGIIELAKEGLMNDIEGYRAEFVRLVKLYD